MELSQVDLTDNDFLEQYVQGDGLSGIIQDTMKLMEDIGGEGGMDLSPFNGLLQTMNMMIPDKRLTLGELMSLGSEDDIIQSMHKLSLSVKHSTVLEELVTSGYIRAANCYCTTYSYTPSSEIAEIAQEQVLPFFLEYIDHPRLTHGLNLFGSTLMDLKGALNKFDMNNDLLNMDVFNNIIEGKDFHRNGMEEYLNLNVDELKAKFLSNDSEVAHTILSEFIKNNRLDIVKVALESGYPPDKALDIAYEYGQDEIADYILTQLPEAEVVKEISLDALGEDDD